MYHRPVGYRNNFYSQTSAPSATQYNLVNVQMADLGVMNQPGFYYLWTMK